MMQLNEDAESPRRETPLGSKRISGYTFSTPILTCTQYMTIKTAAFLKVVLFLIVSGCLPMPRTFKSELGCFDDTFTGLDSLINLKGVYREMQIVDNRGMLGTSNEGKLYPISKIDTFYHYDFFFKNGLYIGDIADYSTESTLTYVRDCAINGTHVNGGLHGVYSVDGNIIKVKFINIGGYDNGIWGGAELWYKIVDKNTLVMVYERAFSHNRRSSSKKEYRPVKYSGIRPLKFIPIDTIPKPYIYFMEKKWFNCKD